MDDPLDLMEESDMPQPSRDDSLLEADSDGEEDEDGMDELANLMQEEYVDLSSNSYPSTSVTEQSGAAASSFSSSRGSEVRDTERKVPKTRTSIKVTPPPVRPPVSRPTTGSHNDHKIKPVEVPVDDRLGIRMSNRLVSSVDLNDLISDHPYFSPASLSAMSLARLNTLLLDPTRVVDAATVAGKTNVVTVGIVFSNSGTRLSSKGGAFCVLTIGNFVSGPCLTVFLFGDAYGKHCRTCTAGKVIALMGPKLLPSNRGDSTKDDASVSFSVYELGQIQLVATAIDFGFCKGSARVKQPDGKWTLGGQCKAYVNKRVSEYCDHHRRHQKTGGASSSNLLVASRKQPPVKQFQHLKQDTATVPPVHIVSARFGSSNRFLCQKKQPATGRQPEFNMSASTATRKSATNSAFGVDSMTNVPSNNLRNIPMHMRKQPQPLSERRTVNSSSTSNVNRFLKRKTGATSAAGPDEKRNRTAANDGSVRGNDWLTEATATARKRSTSFSRTAYTDAAAQPSKGILSTGRRSSKVNTAGSGEAFDGSVLVPKPSRIFQAQASTMTERTIATNNLAARQEAEDKKRDELLQVQMKFAKRIKEAAVGGGGMAKEKSARRDSASIASIPKTRNKQGQDSDDAFLAAMGEIDHEMVRNAKSQFSNEIEAEEYANSRRKVIELEKLEAAQVSRSKKNASQDQKRMDKAWFCKNCGQQYSFMPKSCVTANHEVRTLRTLKESATKEQRRSQLHSRNVEDGGLLLGSGLDWSSTNRVGWSRFS